MYEQYLRDPASVSEDWRALFDNGKLAELPIIKTDRAEVLASATPAAPQAAAPGATPAQGMTAITGPAARLVHNMTDSLGVPTATSFRDVAVATLASRRQALNAALAPRNLKVSFTHLIGWGIVQAVKQFPVMGRAFHEVDGKPHRFDPDGIHLGLAVDVERKDGSRALVVPVIKHAEAMDFAAFHTAYETLVEKARSNRLLPDDFAGATITLTNPGTIGTVASVPRLLKGQGAIIATGAIEYPAETQSMSEESKAAFAISRVMMITSTYDHRVIQGAESGAFLARVHELVEGKHNFYAAIFAALRVRLRPFTIARDRKLPFVAIEHTKNALERSARVAQLVHAFRNYGHLLSDLDPLGLDDKPRRHPELDLEYYGFTIWDLDREFYAAGIGGKKTATLREILDMLQDFYGGTVGIEITHLLDSAQRAWLLERVENPAGAALPPADEQWQILRKLIEADDFERFLHTRYVGK